MPLYPYRCTRCDAETELIHGMDQRVKVRHQCKKGAVHVNRWPRGCAPMERTVTAASLPKDGTYSWRAS